MNHHFATPAEVETAFYQAFQALDLALMDAVWENGREVVCVHPAGQMLRGKHSVMQSWARLFDRAYRPALLFQPRQASVAEDLAVHLVEELIRTGEGGDSAPTRVVTTNVYRRGEDGWRLLIHHASLPLVEGGPSNSPMLH